MALTVGQLKAILAHPDIGDDTIVVLARDPEGNGFNPVPDDEGEQIWSHSLGFYDPNDGEFTGPPDDDERDGEIINTWEWLLDNGQKALCLWPS